MTDQHAHPAPKELLQAQRLANTLDTAVKLPVVGIEVGLDFLLGLVPVVGDACMLLLSLRIIHLGKKMGMPSALIKKMVRNAGIDMVLGFIPFVGDIADIFYKANRANVRLMEKWWISNNKQEVDNYAAKQLAKWEKNQNNI
ncbi:DUF4112 domain-containing protein [Alteromonas sediminis]|uniref:DUF4112 domain-containing protein n=1 Tax=Alteromonas sediminis TaxID=2259342 RepID=A0A3N5Y4Z3_9ALTE|nr:DUF4112 domain-containing protein [Alteromonas sediminis]RPJ65249.1 DUF4112 domain-containing protein [Alteromonas sediminis]